MTLTDALARLHPLELEAMRLDGDLVAEGPLGAGILRPLDAPLTRLDRAAALASRVPRSVVVARSTAAWVYDGYAPGRRLAVHCLTTRRTWEPEAGLDVRYGRLLVSETTRIGGLAITTTARTIADLALDAERRDDAETEADAAAGTEARRERLCHLLEVAIAEARHGLVAESRRAPASRGRPSPASVAAALGDGGTSAVELARLARADVARRVEFSLAGRWGSQPARRLLAEVGLDLQPA